ncbi:MAG: hypothetical protein E7319_05550 [Clostridiales bacterium]|nr:hypothetical protein [Clostridiales bacterium]
MKKILAILLCLMLVLTSLSAFAAEAQPAASVCLITKPAVPEEIHTQWQLFQKEPDLHLDVRGVVEETGENLVVTLDNLDTWGVAPEALTTWTYDQENRQWVAEPLAEGAAQRSAVLRINAYFYYMNGFPTWECKGTGDIIALQLDDYSGDPNNPDYQITVQLEDATVGISLAGEGFTLGSYSDDTMSYCIYTQQGVLTYANYFVQHENGDLATYAVTLDQTTGGYPLTFLNIIGADGSNVLWTEGEWFDINDNSVAAPAGYENPEDLPFTLVTE